jgi:hypothetical protein
MSDPDENFSDPYEQRREEKFYAVRAEAKMLAAIAAGFFSVGTAAWIMQSSASEAISTACQGLMICSYVATTVIGAWSFLRYTSVADARPALDERSTVRTVIGQLIGGFILGVLAWGTFGITLAVTFIVAMTGSGKKGSNYGMLLAGAMLGAIFPPLAIFIICGMR